MKQKKNHTSESEYLPHGILARENGSSIAYHKIEGKSPGVIFMAGFMSDMEGNKASSLEDLCQQTGNSFLRFDYQGHGISSGELSDGTISTWTEDALAALDQLTTGPQIIVGSSMGGWIMLLIAIARRERISGLVGISAAPDFTEDLIPNQLNSYQLSEIKEKGQITIASEYEDPYTITNALLEDGAKNLILRSEIPIDCPVKLLHGLEDVSVPWQTALQIQSLLRSADVDVTLIKNGDHRLSREQDIELLKRTVLSII